MCLFQNLKDANLQLKSVHVYTCLVKSSLYTLTALELLHSYVILMSLSTE